MNISEEEMRKYCKDGDKFCQSVKIQFGAVLREARLENGLSLEDVVAIIGWSEKKWRIWKMESAG